MTLKKWGEIKTKRRHTAGIIGGVVMGILGLVIMPISYKPLGFVVGLLLGFLVFHLFDPTDTIVYKYEEEPEQSKKS